jgi:hypothetical protein
LAPSLLDSERTHGQWPWAAAGLAPLTTALAWRARERLAAGEAWVFRLPVPALLWHQTEEWFLPGGFLPWFNREVLGSDEDEFPITRPLGFGINVGLGWGGALGAALVGPRVPGLAAWMHAMNLGNVAVHAGGRARAALESRARDGCGPVCSAGGCLARSAGEGSAGRGRASGCGRRGDVGWHVCRPAAPGRRQISLKKLMPRSSMTWSASLLSWVSSFV